MSFEEENHAALIRSMCDVFAPLGLMPAELLDCDLQRLNQANKRIETAIAQYLHTTPEHRIIFELAIELEETAGEFHYQQIMESKVNSKAIQLVQKLNRDDIDHKQRIENYMRQVGY